MTKNQPNAPTFERFRALTKKLVSVPKKEIEKRAAKYEKAKQKRRSA